MGVVGVSLVEDGGFIMTRFERDVNAPLHSGILSAQKLGDTTKNRNVFTNARDFAEHLSRFAASGE